jgi:RNA polymerase sigma-70 factor, ECF subfamily
LINDNNSGRENAASDEVLVAKSKNGDKTAFEILVKRYSKYVYTTAFFMIRDSHEAEDISQEVFVKVYLAIGGFRGLSSFKTWLRKLTVNTCIDKIRLKSKISDKKVSLDSMIEDGKEIMLYEFNQNVEKFFQDKETVKDVLKIIVNLEESYRIPLILRDLQDYSYIEIAEILKKPVGTVKTNIHRARKIIKDLLTGR